MKNPFGILYEDEDIVVVNKSAGIALHEGSNIARKHTLISYLESYYQPQRIQPFLVHRLDKDTSGCLLVAKNKEIVRYLETYFREGKIGKKYVALIKGVPKQRKGLIQKKLPGRKGSLVTAQTFYKILKVYHSARVSLIQVKITTGRKHQIRLHFAHIGHPVIMDQIHGDFKLNKVFRKQYRLKHHFLHAEELSFIWNERTKKIKAPLPPELDNILSNMH